MRHKYFLVTLVISFLLFAPFAAQAEPFKAYVNTGVDMHAGPSNSFPVIVFVPAPVPLSVIGCTRDFTWCDVAWNNNRGWIDGRYLDSVYNNRRVRMAEYCIQADLPTVSFDQQSYWDTYYSKFSFYRNSANWTTPP